MTEPGKPPESTRRSLLGRLLRTVLRALLFAFAFGFAVGTLIRCSAEQARPAPIQYLGASEADAAAESSDGPA